MRGSVGRAGAAVRGRDDVHLLAGLTAVFAWGIGPLFMRGTSVTTPTLVWYRLLVGVPMMAAIAWGNSALPSWRLFKTSFLPAFFFATSMALGFASIKETSIANATLITTIQPVLVMCVAPKMFGERLTLRQVALAAISLAGVLTVVMTAASTSGASLRGDLFALANVCLWTAYFMMAKRVRLDGVSTWSFLSTIFAWSFVILTPWVLVVADDVGEMTAKDWLLVMLMALVPGVIGHGLMTWASHTLEVTTASLIGLASPVISTVGAWLVFEQRLRPMQILGGAVVLGALGLFIREERGTPAERIPPAEDVLLTPDEAR